MDKQVIILGYSGHSYVVIEAIQKSGCLIKGYVETAPKTYNPYQLNYLGDDTWLNNQPTQNIFVGIGNNAIRRKLFEKLASHHTIVNAIHPNSVISKTAQLNKGILIAAGAVINPLVKIGDGVICNTQCSIDHECIIDDFAHIAPGVVLCGNVKVGENSYVGARAVVKENVSIGKNVMIGAGAVVLKNLPDNVLAFGNPCKIIKSI